ncbi:MAG: S8 family serine peptidase [Thermoplasmata archaeon]
MDSELHIEHEMFYDPNYDGMPDEEIEPADNHEKIHAMYAPNRGMLGAGQYHGTHVTGTVLGNAPPRDEYVKHDGHGMDARVIFQDIGRQLALSPPENMYEDGWGRSMDEGSYIHTNSWGGAGGYSGLAIETDEFTWDHRDYTILWAAGNDGPDPETIMNQPHAKNALSIGATANHPIEDNVAGFSSRGYANDGRIKPTILGVGICTSADQTEDGYAGLGGTSMATPGIAGQVSQVRQYYEEGWYPIGYANPSEGFNPSSALIRATLINGAVEVSGNDAYLHGEEFPNRDQGFGRSTIDRALYFEWDERRSVIFDSWNEGNAPLELSTGESWSMDFDVVDDAEELEVTLAWSDYPGEGGAGSIHIVNDLDLELETPDGTRYVGNAYTGHNPGYSEPDPTSNMWNGPRSGEWDGLNVEENILMLPDHNDLQTGTYTLTVTAHSVPSGPQPFAVVVSGGLQPIMAEGTPPSIDITSPSAGDVWEHGDEVDIIWTTTAGADPIDFVDLRYSLDNGESWEFIAEGLPNDGSLTWTVPNVNSAESLIQARVMDNAGRYDIDTSDMFEIMGTPPAPPSGLGVHKDGGPTVVTFEDFADGNYDGWEVHNGSWDASEGYLQGYGKISTPAVMDGEDLDAYGVWEFDFQFTDMDDAGPTDAQIMRFNFISSGNPASPSGYVMTVTGQTAAGPQANLWPLENGDAIGDAPILAGTWTGGTQVSTLRIERDLSNEFTIYIDGGLVGTVVDDTYATTEYIGFNHDPNPLGGEPHIVHNVGALTELEGEPHNILTWDASPDDPGEVSHYNVYRSEDQTGQYELIAEVTADGSQEYTYVDEYKGEDDDITWWYFVRAVGINGMEEDNENTAPEPADGEAPSITLTRPEGGETFTAGEQENILWQTEIGDNPVETIDFKYSTDGGGSWTTIETGLPDTGNYIWTVPDEASIDSLVGATARDSAGRTGSDVSGTFIIEGIPPSPPENLMVEHHGTPEAVVNGIFEGDYEPWELTRTVAEGEARWDSENYIEGGSIYVAVEAEGEGTIRTEDSYWEQDITPTSEEITVSGAFRKNIFYDSNSGIGWSWETHVHHAIVEILVYDTTSGWQTVHIDQDTSVGDSGWGEFAPITYVPDGYADSVRLRMHVEAEGDTGPAGGNHTAIGELWMDHISVTTEGAEGTDDNLLTWDASPDDPDSISHYNIYRSESEAGPWEIPIGSVDADGSLDYEYLDAGAGTGDDTIWWYVVRAVGTNGMEEDNSNVVREPTTELVTYDIELHAHINADGWNFVSFNLIPVESSLEAILEHSDYGIAGNYDKVMYYDASADSWHVYVPGRPDHFNNLQSWNHRMGIWIRLTEDSTLTVEGSIPTQTTITLYPGWNMVGLPSAQGGIHDIPSEVSRVGRFDAAAENNIVYVDVQGFQFQPGQGYWIYNGADVAVDWVVDYNTE